MKKILLVGGGGYIGTLMMEEYSKNKNISQVNSLDWLIYKSQKINKKLLKNKKIKFFYGDFRNQKVLEKSMKNVTDIIILAGLVGDPITKKYKILSDKINLYGIKKLIHKFKDNKKLNKLIFISTCSNYGIVKNKLANEETKLSPKSRYAKAKVEIEKYILGLKKKNFSPVVLRFATAFGFSNRMRYDLTINEFCKEIYNNKELIVYDPNTWRPYCHVKDFSRIVYKVLFSPNHVVNNQVFNVGSNKNNYRKKDIVNIIKKYRKKAKVKYLQKSVDPRDYRVDFKKITKVLNIKPRYSADYGIKEIFKKLKMNRKSLDNGNYVIKSNVK
tara:strand:- start:765 stop:1751 length:987 start_codon:yes stop_codon:yes gene_type:complete